ncbi:DegV family protein [Clostridium beijerinckii]|uniref:DegV family protein with EDD domain n=1 Tax=Clostridium beijerinckii TaxID=1520 RepID=A0AAX0AZL8_CLOBE|nr:DegV family protein [Clostridium beijerinckii]NOW03402.1 DegV family protein with EDD domain [Clostridium beijerinckii]NRT34306.1 DegV family protein with EDD domain [Clostridium beijerinckii]NRT46263.1 DegV family protein with EDD domain [Clostridium beijerinckii]NRT70954.1 DegV family protein with EDD domain [Clostridium beijerinckii]NRT88357.1 DegV family protein with EDD domain [Clostridium beijerinckii]
MEKIALITDSASDISIELLEANKIRLLPFKIIYSDKEYEDRIDITPQFMYERLKTEIPKTSLPSIEKITSVLKEVVSEGFTHAIIITISSAFSGTYNAVRLICEEFEELKTFVFDSRTLTMAEGAMVLETARLIREGKTFNEIIEILPTYREKIDLFFTIDTLEYLQKGGRIGKVAGTIGEFLNLKPIITVAEDGTYRTAAKVRGSKQAVSKLTSIFKMYLEKGRYKAWILDGNGFDKVQNLYCLIKDLPNVVECTIAGTIGPALGVNTGPGLVGLAIERVDE